MSCQEALSCIFCTFLLRDMGHTIYTFFGAGFIGASIVLYSEQYGGFVKKPPYGTYTI